MNKLTEILDRLHDINFCRGMKYYKAVETFNTNAPTDIEYLLSLLEEKNKALSFYADSNNYTYQYETDEDEPQLLEEPIMADDGEIARKALNTSLKEELQ